MRDIYRIAKIIARGEKGVDPLADLFLEDPLTDDCKEVRDICTNKIKRMYMEAALLSTEDVDKICKVFGFKTEVVELYEKAYFNVFGLSKLEKAWLVDGCDDAQEQNMKRWAFSQGIDFLAWRLGLKVELSPIEGMTSLYADCYYKAKEAFFNPNSSEASKEALKWTKQASELSRILKSWVTNNNEAMKDIEMALSSLGSSDMDFGDIKGIKEENGDPVQGTLEFENDIDFGDINDIRNSNDD